MAQISNQDSTETLPSTQSPPTTQDMESQVRAMMENIQPKQDSDLSVASWLLQDFNSHKERLIKGFTIFSL
jgi:hypothetical protein